MKAPIILTGLVAVVLGSQGRATFTGRWVGYNQGETLHLEFYGDTMLVVNDSYALTYSVTPDSLVATGDTTLRARYWFALDRLLLETPGGVVVTMSKQDALARPLTGRWLGDLGTPDQVQAELVLTASGTARWRRLPEGAWQHGEWDRQTRIITVVWAADSTDWIGHYDVEGNAIIFEHTIPESRPTVFHRVFRP
jgi:hypothetical protein